MFLSHSEGSENSTTPVSHRRSVTYAVPVTLENLLNLVAAKIPNKWYEFGILLSISPEELDTYNHTPIKCFARVFTTWEKNTSPDYTWETVIDNLESPTIKEKRLAQEIRRKVTICHSPSPLHSAAPLSRAAAMVDSRTKTRYMYETDV